MTIDTQFDADRTECIKTLGANSEMNALSNQWLSKAQEHRYSYNFDWMGLPIIQYPQDIVAMQEIIWRVKPDLIIETGIARGGSLIFYASMLELLACCGGDEGSVVAIDIDIRDHNRRAIEDHPMSKRIEMIQGSAIAPEIVAQVKSKAEGKKRVLISLDSDHTHDHVLEELRAYAGMVTPGSYIVAFDTLVEDISDEAIGDRPWSKGNNPKTAVWEFLKEDDRFVIDASIHQKLQVTVAPDGFLKRVK
jgi:cephalosporin hydroxylase